MYSEEQFKHDCESFGRNIREAFLGTKEFCCDILDGITYATSGQLAKDLDNDWQMFKSFAFVYSARFDVQAIVDAAYKLRKQLFKSGKKRKPKKLADRQESLNRLLKKLKSKSKECGYSSDFQEVAFAVQRILDGENLRYIHNGYVFRGDLPPDPAGDVFGGAFRSGLPF